MKIAYVTTFDARDIRRGSGTFYYMSREIERQGHDVTYVGPLTYRPPRLSKLVAGAHRRLGKRHALFIDPGVARDLGEQVTERLQSAEIDAIITNDVGVAAYTKSDRPIVLYTDVMISADYSERERPGARLGNMSPVSLALARRTLRRGITRADACVFPAQWVADAAFAYAPVQAKTHIIPFGANIDDPGPDVATKRTVRSDAVKLLFVGKDWVRKGGDVAVAAVATLRNRGIAATLHCVGGVPTGADPEQVVAYGLLDKSNDSQRAQLHQLYSECDLFILPSSSEGFVIAVLEAAAFGMPAVCYAADGVGVVDGVTGRALPLGSSAETFADTIQSLLDDPTTYRNLALQARRHYDETVNWTKAVQRLMSITEALTS